MRADLPFGQSGTRTTFILPSCYKHTHSWHIVPNTLGISEWWEYSLYARIWYDLGHDASVWAPWTSWLSLHGQNNSQSSHRDGNGVFNSQRRKAHNSQSVGKPRPFTAQEIHGINGPHWWGRGSQFPSQMRKSKTQAGRKKELIHIRRKVKKRENRKITETKW